MENFALIFTALLIGYVLQKFRLFPDNAAVTLNQYIIYIALPAMILLEVPKLSPSMDMLIPVVTAWTVMAFSAILVIISSNIFGFSKNITGSMMLVAVLTNSSFLGIPLIQTYLGTDALGYILVYDQLGTALALSTYGTFVAAWYSQKSEVNTAIIIQKILSFPPFIALVTALLLSGVAYGPVAQSVLKTLSDTIVPLALVAVGLQLKLRLPGHEVLPFGTALLIKLFAAPLIAIGLCQLFSWDTMASQVSILEAGMAPMITAGAMASLVGLAPRLSSAIVGYGILISFVTSWGLTHFL